MILSIILSLNVHKDKKELPICGNRLRFIRLFNLSLSRKRPTNKIDLSALYECVTLLLCDCGGILRFDVEDFHVPKVRLGNRNAPLTIHRISQYLRDSQEFHLHKLYFLHFGELYRYRGLLKRWRIHDLSHQAVDIVLFQNACRYTYSARPV